MDSRNSEKRRHDDPGEGDVGRAVFAFALVEGFSMMSLTAAIEPLRAANRLAGRDAYRWRLLGPDGGPVRASNGIPIAVDAPLDGAGNDAALIVCAGLVTEPRQARLYHAALRRAARAGRDVGALSTGAFVLARAGLLDGYRCTIHWEALPAFRAAFPDIACGQKIYEVDRTRYTCSGGIAAMDMMLDIVGRDLGSETAGAVANQFHLARIRSGSDDQRTGTLANLDAMPAALRRAVSLMQANIEQPLAVSAIGRQAGVGVRQLERLFIRHLHWSPARFYTRLRLERARELLIHGNLPILEVALASGFSSSSYFAESFRAFYGFNPSAVRRAAANATGDTEPRGRPG
jgi:AraC family transcriptional regulator, glycine betaine-responsive activator